jgi:hypothetical protein
VTAPSAAARGNLVAQLVDLHTAGAVRYLGLTAADNGRYVVEVEMPGNAGPVRREHPLPDAYCWLEGFRDGQRVAGARMLPPRRQAPEPLRTLLVAPSVDDARRARLWWAMEMHGLTLTEVARRMRADRQTPRGLLTYGATPARRTVQSRTLDEIEQAVRDALPRRFALGAPPRRPRRGAEQGPIGPLSVPRREPRHLRALRALALAYESGLVSTWEPVDPNEFRTARDVCINPGLPHLHRSVSVAASGAIAWTQGLADGAARARPYEPLLGGTDRLTELARALTEVRM